MVSVLERLLDRDTEGARLEQEAVPEQTRRVIGQVQVGNRRVIQQVLHKGFQLNAVAWVRDLQGGVDVLPRVDPVREAVVDARIGLALVIVVTADRTAPTGRQFEGVLRTHGQRGLRRIWQFVALQVLGNAVAERNVDAKGLKQMSDSGELDKIVDGVLAANPKNVEEYKAGNAKALNALVGQIMKGSKGKANPAQVNDLLRKKLG